MHESVVFKITALKRTKLGTNNQTNSAYGEIA